MSENPTVKLRVVPAPASGQAVSAPPVLQASDQSTDYLCGTCGVVLLHAQEDQVHGLIIRCTNCGSHNSTEC